MRKLSLRQIRSLFFFQGQIAINVVGTNWYAQHTVRPKKNRKVGAWSGESFTAGPCKEKGEAPALKM